ncbi:scavenger receptor cysteine-rich domain-containing group B protein-like [Megalobrama amblycephala]|uniref:scavenger receptor cysteine-rich domain-containing group B protein-like n=1 Tax=Megalobrama amblycephala TaxID=75352 RepID=UPI002014774A|nr:scavenger receptor cysteine-rich domain-containing group B protein-like [Megalobrama amblycephala]
MWMVLLGLVSGLLASSRSEATAVVRLVNGPNVCSGRVEVLHNGIWGAVCDDSWDSTDVAVVCREMGCGSVINATTNAYFGRGSGKIWLDDVQCHGDESTLKDCSSSGWGIHNCGYSEEAGVICQASTPVLWTQTSATVSPVEDNETDQTDDTNYTEHTEESTTSQPTTHTTELAMSERTPANKTVSGDVNPINTSSGSDTDMSLKWLINVLTMLAVLLIVLICVIVARKRWCGKKQSSSAQNGAPASVTREQEMVTLVNNE